MSLATFEDRDGVIWYDGKLVPWRDAQLHVLNHGLHYAASVFEGERIYDGKVFKLREHSQRLIDSARLVGYEIPYTLAEIEKATLDTVAASKIDNGYIRPIAWRGSEQMGVAAQNAKIHLAIAIWEWPSYFPAELRQKGIKVMMSPWKRPSPETAPTKAKASGLYMICTLSKHAAEAQGCQDALMLDWRGRIAETTSANIFLVMDGELHTPIPDCFLDGITRQTVIELAKKRGFKVVERTIMPEELGKTQEVFLTGTAAEITPVGEIGEYRFTPGPITAALLTEFDRLVGRAPATAAAE
jgi:branched-chain amino acid aminotransferase